MEEKVVTFSKRSEKEAFVIFFFLGVSLLLSWNVLLLQLDYFYSIYPNDNISAYISVAYLFPSFILTIGTLFFGHLLSIRLRIFVGFFFFFLVIFSVPWLSLLFSNLTSFRLTLLFSFLCGIGEGFAQPSSFSLASLFNQNMLTALWMVPSLPSLSLPFLPSFLSNFFFYNFL